VQNLSELTLLGWVSALGGKTPVPAGGALSLVTLSGASSLAEKVVRNLGRDSSALEGLSLLFLLAASEDAASYAAARKEGPDAARRCLETGLRHLETTLDLLGVLSVSFDEIPPPLVADMAAAGRLARASAETLIANLAVNLTEWERNLGPGDAESIRQRLSAIKLRLDSA
jgi:formiminotetrahydrofolate cyclodeaminase